MLSLWDLRAKDPAANTVVLGYKDKVFAVAISPDNPKNGNGGSRNGASDSASD